MDHTQRMEDSHGVQTRKKSEKLQLQLWGMLPKGNLLRLLELPSEKPPAPRVLLSRGRGKDLRPILRTFRPARRPKTRVMERKWLGLVFPSHGGTCTVRRNGPSPCPCPSITGQSLWSQWRVTGPLRDGCGTVAGKESADQQQAFSRFEQGALPISHTKPFSVSNRERLPVSKNPPLKGDRGGCALNAVDLSCLNQCNNTFTSFPRRRESSFCRIFRIPAFAGMTW